MFRRFSIDQLSTLTPRRIAVIKPSALGDVAQTLPLLGVLKEVYPGAKIDWVINSSFANLLENHPLLDTVIPYERRGSWRDWMQLLRRLKSSKYDLVFDLQGLLRTGIMTQATGAPVRIGLECAREGAWLAYHASIPQTTHGQPAHELYWQLAKLLGHGDSSRNARIALSESDRRWASDRLSGFADRTLTIAAGAQWITKRWPAEKFVDIAVRAAGEFGFGICLVGTGAERELTSQIEQQFRSRSSAPIVNVAGETTLKQLSAILESSRLVLSNDSGPLHLAAALETPVVGIFLCTSEVRSGPVGDRNEVVATRVHCAASYKKSCPQTGGDCMACKLELDAERVWRAVVRCLEQNPRQKSAVA